MLRTCNGSDRYLITEDGTPCACGLTFDDVRYSTVHPHPRIPTREERASILDRLSRRHGGGNAPV